MYSIYKIENVVTKKVYIGKTKLDIQERFNQHISSSQMGDDTHFYNSLRKHGKDSFQLYLIEDNILDNTQANEREIYHINEFNSFHDGYNSTIGGDGGSTRSGMKNSTEMKTKQSISQLGKKKRNPGMCGKYKKSEDQRKKISLSSSKYRWVTNPTTDETIRINETELEDYLKRGYQRGRSNRFKKKSSENNQFKNKPFLSPEVQEELRLRNKERLWVVSEDGSKFIHSSELEDYLKRGYQRGRKIKVP
jgi:group I intron endonuclease